MVKKKSLSPEEELLKEVLVPEEEQPYKVPDNWVWTTIGNIAEVIRGVTYSKNQAYSDESNDRCLILRGGNIQNGEIVNNDNIYVPRSCVLEQQFVKAGDVVVVASSGSKNLVGKAAQVDKDSNRLSFGTFLSLIRNNSFVNHKYFGLYFQTQLYRNAIATLSTGININNIKRSHLESLRFPVPPFSEQHRIVTKVESLRSKINEVKQLIEEARETFAQRRDVILAKAFRGELTQKWREGHPNLEPADVLLERITAEKEMLNEGKNGIRMHMESSPFEPPYDLPEGWSWVFLNDVCIKIGDIDHSMPKAIEEGIPFISPRDFINDNGIDFNNSKKISKEDFDRLARKIRPENGDIIFARYGTVGVTRFVNTNVDFLASYSCAVIKPIKKNMNAKYVFYYTNSKVCQDEVIKYINETTQANVGIKSIKKFLFPLPPIEEQNKIVSILNKVLGIETKIKELNNLEQYIGLVQKSILSKAFQGHLGTNDLKEKSVVELLKK